MSQLSTAGRLLGELHREASALRDTVASAAGIVVERAEATMNGAIRLSLAEQLRLSEATLVLAPRYTRQALRLRGQALAARSYESGEVQVHTDSPAERWERSPQMRR
jgi:hypothetical protein